MERVVTIGGVPCGSGHPPVLFAEIGSYFNGDADLAASMIEAIVEASRRFPHRTVVVKTEILDDPEICLPGDLMETYASKRNEVRRENYRALIERKVLPLPQYARLFRICSDAQLPFVVSVYDFKAADFAAKHGAAALKIASSNIVHVPLIRHSARLGLPMVIDTGRSTLAEVQRAVDTARAAGCEDIVVQHSPDGHPALPEAHNLRILQTYARLFQLPTGLSDHYVGVEMLYMAIALGASVLEKGVHVDPEELDQDISHSMALDRLLEVLNALHACWEALGEPVRDPRRKLKGVVGSSQRQCLVARRDLQPGDTVDLDTMRFAFPCRGIPVEHWDLVAGWQLTRPVPVGTPVSWSDVCRRPD